MSDLDYLNIVKTIEPTRTVELQFIQYPDGLILLVNDSEFCEGQTMKRTGSEASALWEFLKNHGFIKP